MIKKSICLAEYYCLKLKQLIVLNKNNNKETILFVDIIRRCKNYT